MNVLVIDDRRTLEGARIARTYAEGIAALAERHWDVLYLDHDLGDFSGPDGRELTGYSVMCWLEEHREHLPGKIVVVTDNGSGRQKIELVINKLYRR